MRTRARFAALLALSALAGGLSACGAVYPELSAPIRAAPSRDKLSPPPPEDVVYLEIKQALIPKRTRDGRSWDPVGGELPDPFALLFDGDRELLRTPVEPNTLEPTWPDAERGNYRIGMDSVMRIEIWDSNALTHRPICVSPIEDIHTNAGNGFVDINCDSGARVSLIVEPARAVYGLGLYYELRAEDVFITRVLEESPASRVGLERGTQILQIQGQNVRGKDTGEVQSLINANCRSGVGLLVRKPDGTVDGVELKEGPIYPLVSEHVDLV